MLRITAVRRAKGFRSWLQRQLTTSRQCAFQVGRPIFRPDRIDTRLTQEVVQPQPPSNNAVVTAPGVSDFDRIA
jgi:hypothetical protein